MNIELEKNIRLESDETQLILKRMLDSFDKKGKQKYRVLGYYTTLKEALCGYSKHKVRTSNAETLRELIDEIKKLDEHIDDLVRGETK